MSEHIKDNRVVQIDDLLPHPRNFHIHPDEQISDLVLSLERFGQGRSIVIQDAPGKHLIVAGHGVVQAAMQIGWKEIRADVLPASWTPEQIEGYLIADNLHSQKASDDETLLTQLLQEQQDAGYDLASLGSDEEALRQMLESLGDTYVGSDEGEEEEDDSEPEIEEQQTRVKPGDIWQLGRHKIACLDSCEPEAIRELVGDEMVTFVWSDPPYGISIVKPNGHIGGGKTSAFLHGETVTFPENKYALVIGDDSTVTAITSFRLCQELFPKALQIWWGANHYSAGLPSSSCWVVWDKENDTISDFADCELAWCSHKGAVRIFRHLWNGMVKASEQGIRRVHPNQKPVKLAEWAFEKYGKENDIIFDPFLGSGISLIAAERLGHRTVIGCELSPDYCNVCIRRWEAHTGQTATLLERAEETSHA